MLATSFTPIYSGLDSGSSYRAQQRSVPSSPVTLSPSHSGGGGPVNWARPFPQRSGPAQVRSGLGTNEEELTITNAMPSYEGSWPEIQSSIQGSHIEATPVVLTEPSPTLPTSSRIPQEPSSNNPSRTASPSAALQPVSSHASPNSSPASSTSPRMRTINLPFPTRIPAPTTAGGSRSRAGSDSSNILLNVASTSPSSGSDIPASRAAPTHPPLSPMGDSRRRDESSSTSANITTHDANDQLYRAPSREEPWITPPEVLRSDRMIRDEVAPFRILSPHLLDPSSGKLEFGRRDRFTEQELLRQTPLAAVDPLGAMEKHMGGEGLAFGLGLERQDREGGPGGDLIQGEDGETWEMVDSPSRRNRSQQQDSYRGTPGTGTPTPLGRDDMRRRVMSSATSTTSSPAARTPTKSMTTPSKSGLSSSPSSAFGSASTRQRQQAHALSSSRHTPNRSLSNKPSPSHQTPTQSLSSSLAARRGHQGSSSTPRSLAKSTSSAFGHREGPEDENGYDYQASMLGGEDAVPPPSSESSFSKGDLRNWDEVVLPSECDVVLSFAFSSKLIAHAEMAYEWNRS